MEPDLTSPTKIAPVNPTPGDYGPFTPELKVRFCEALAETGTVSAACRAVGKHRDTIYEHLRTDPLFAAACDSARHHARHRLADRLMEDSIAGSVDHLYRDGMLVGERRYTDNRLAFAMLRRLDKLAEEPRSPAPRRTFDAKLALKALRTGSEEDLCAALATLDSDTSDTSDNPSFDDEDLSDSTFGTDRVWQEEEEDGGWWTNFPPPEGFTGYERGHWSDEDYARECSGDESALLDAAREAELSDMKAAEEAERITFFAELEAELDGSRDPSDGSPGAGAARKLVVCGDPPDAAKGSANGCYT